jgi:hypothetical protein
MSQLPTSRLILAILCGSYLLSAALLTWARMSGQVVPAWKIAGWALTGTVGAVLLYWLAPHRPAISIAMLIVLAPWMAFALYEDTQSKHFVIAVIDLAGLFAIGFALWLVGVT